MSRSVRLGLFSSSVLVVLVSIATLMYLPIGTSRATPSGPPEILVDDISISAPATGSDVTVITSPDSFETDSVDTSTVILIKNETTGVTTATQTYDEIADRKFTIVAEYGDLISIKADNGTPGSTTENIGYVPAPSDAAVPDFVLTGIDTELASGDFTVDFGIGAIKDESFDLEVTLTIGAASQTETVAGTLSNDDPFDLVVAASAGDRAVVTATDDYGNTAELHFIVDQDVATDGVIGNWSAISAHVDAERTGRSVSVALGDGNSAVTGEGEFLHGQTLHSISGPIQSFSIGLAYRSALSGDALGNTTYDGPVGVGFDTNLDSRMEYDAVAKEYFWYPGNGRREGPFEYDSFSSPYSEFDSPAGIFMSLKKHASNGELYLESGSGDRLVFDSADGYLKRIEDYYGQTAGSTYDLNRIDFIRNLQNQVVQIIEGGVRITDLAWFDHGRLAAVRDHSGRETVLRYTDDGQLDTIDSPQYGEYEFKYTTSTNLLETVEQLLTMATFTVVKNTYESTGDRRLTAHRNRDNQPSGDSAMSFTYHADPGAGSGDYDVLEVVDAEGVTHAFGIAQAAPHEMLWSETWSDLDLRTGELDAWRVNYTIDDDVLLLVNRSYETIDDHNETTFDPTSSTGTLEKESWTYKSPLADDATLRSRVEDHLLHSTTSGNLTETWTYGGTGNKQSPTRHTSFEGRVTLYTRNAAEQLTKERNLNVSRPVQAAHDIVTEYSYTANGQLEGVWDANRDASTDDPLTEHSYFTSGASEGYRQKTETLDTAGVVKKTASWTYDSLGRVTTATDVLGGVTTWEYTDSDQVDTVTGPVVTLTHPDANSATVQTVTEYDYDRGVVTEMRVADIDELGVTQSGWIETDYTYYTGLNESGRVLRVEADLNSSDRSKVEYAYNDRGERTEVKTFNDDTGAETWSKQITVYDDRGLVFQSKQDTEYEDTATLDTDRLVTEYDYDFVGRVVERTDPHGVDATVTTYDEYGRRESETSPVVDIGKNASGIQVDGQYRTEWEYDDDGLVVRVEKSTVQKPAGGSWTLWANGNTSTTLYDYDEAGRRVTTWSACVTDPQEPPTTYPDDWSERSVDLHQGGQVDRSYIPGFATTEYHEEDLDDLNRVTKKTSSTGNVIEYEYTGTGGQLSKDKATPYDDAAGAAGPTFGRTYTYDEAGRVTEERFLGNQAGSPVEAGVKHAYDGNGRRVRTIEFEGTTDGVVATTEYDEGGRVTEVRRGDSATGGRFEEVETTYDLAGRVLTEKQVEDQGSTTRDTVYSYDGADRVTNVVLPDRSSTDTREIDYSYGFDSEEGWVKVEDANSVEVKSTYNTIGQLREEAVTKTGAPTHIANGNTAVLYYYGGDTACGCGGANKATYIKATGGHETATVSRTFDAQGSLTLEVITVGSCESVTTKMEYHKAGWRTRLTYSDAVQSGTPAIAHKGTTVRKNYKSDGRVLDVEWLSSTDPDEWKTLLEYEYRGAQLVEMKQNYKDGTLLSKMVQTFNDNNYVTKTEWEDAAGTSVLTRKEYVRNGAGYLTAALHPTAGTTGGDWMHFEYEGPHWLKSFTWYDAATAETGSEYRKRTYTRNGFGERSTVADTGLPDQDGKTNDWTMKRDDAGHYIGESAATSDRVFTYEDTSPYNEDHAIRAHVHLVDAMGLRYESTFTFEDRGATCEDEDYTWDYTFDAWGRVSKATRERVCGGTTRRVDYEYVYDGLGRLVHRTIASQSSYEDPNVTDSYEYYGYEGSSLVTTIERDDRTSCNVLKLSEKIHGLPGYPPMKERERPGGGGDDEEFLSYHVDVCGGVLAVNAAVADDGLAEVATFVFITELPTGEKFPLGDDFQEASEGENSEYYLPGYLSASEPKKGSTGVKKTPTPPTPDPEEPEICGPPDPEPNCCPKKRMFCLAASQEFKRGHNQRNLGELISGVEGKLDECECIGTLEIEGHGHASHIVLGDKSDNGTSTDAATFLWRKNKDYVAERLAGLDFCCPCTILLSGCHTGNSKRPNPWPQVLADKTGCTVKGTKGYCTGRVFDGDVEIGHMKGYPSQREDDKQFGTAEGWRTFEPAKKRQCPCEESTADQ